MMTEREVRAWAIDRAIGIYETEARTNGIVTPGDISNISATAGMFAAWVLAGKAEVTDGDANQSN